MNGRQKEIYSKAVKDLYGHIKSESFEALVFAGYSSWTLCRYLEEEADKRGEELPQKLMLRSRVDPYTHVREAQETFQGTEEVLFVEDYARRGGKVRSLEYLKPGTFKTCVLVAPDNVDLGGAKVFVRDGKMASTLDFELSTPIEFRDLD